MSEIIHFQLLSIPQLLAFPQKEIGTFYLPFSSFYTLDSSDILFHPLLFSVKWTFDT